ncbi:MAG TPA: cytochrome c maturation protein CcmE, partial [Actinomycetota bacterium]|nr:cytochrome c maturation protein CcmE [Actinomycetota bacterium]
MSPRVRFSIAAGVVVVSILSLIGWALSGSTSYYKTPTELASGSVDPHARVRVAGKVVAGSVVVEGPTTSFEVSDGAGQIPVTTRDLLPDTFGAGVEVVA